MFWKIFDTIMLIYVCFFMTYILVLLIQQYISGQSFADRIVWKKRDFIQDNDTPMWKTDDNMLQRLRRTPHPWIKNSHSFLRQNDK